MNKAMTINDGKSDADLESSKRVLEEAIDRFQRELDAMHSDEDRRRAVASLQAKFLIETARLPMI